MAGVRQVLLGLVGLTLLATPAAGAVAPAPTRAAVVAPTSVLRAGQRLVADSARSSLVNGDFALTVSSDFLELDQNQTLNGPEGVSSLSTGTWYRDDPTGRHQVDGDRTTLGLRRTGNLVLADSHGAVLWTSRTAGTGSGNRLVLTSTGNLVLSTATGRAVWKSRTTAVYFPAGSTLGSGRRLVDGWGDQEPHAVPQTLTMQGDGNLVRRCGAHVLWQSRTHVRGSELRLRTDGGLVIVAPHGRTVWSAHSGGHDSYAYLAVRDVTVREANLTYDAKPLWDPKYPFYAC